MKEFLVVDGYNIIFAWPEFEKHRDNDLEYARHKLVSVLANYHPLSGQKIFVVFDAHQVKHSTERVEKIEGVEVIYTQQGETADTFIESLVGRLFDEGTVYVATSDWAEQGIIFGRGAYRITPGELREQINRLKHDSEKHYTQRSPSEGYLENRLVVGVRSELERIRRKKK